MDKYIGPPDALLESKDMNENWKKWKNDFLKFMRANNNMGKSEYIKIDMLKHHIGIFGRNVIEKLVSNDPNANTLRALLLKLDNCFITPINLVAERYNFFTSIKNRNESIEVYVHNLKERASSCNFGRMRDSLIRDKIIAELKDRELINILIQKENLDLLSLISIYNNHYSAIQQKKQNTSWNNTSNKKLETYKNDSLKNIPNGRNCRRCNQRHPIRCCPAWGCKCEQCGQYHHFTHCCARFNSRNEMEKQNPSAPPLSDIDNILYPDMNYMKTLQGNMNTNTWTWLEQQATANKRLQQTAVNEQLQQTTANTQLQQTTENKQLQQTAVNEKLQQSTVNERLGQNKGNHEVPNTSKLKFPVYNSETARSKTKKEECSIS